VGIYAKAGEVNSALQIAACISLLSIAHQLRCIRGILQGWHPKWWQL
jgi:hypothetical protein